ncbi:MAG: zinc ribbon domain-containing protein [Candidatus Bathyarchaeota archaeon]|nr:zinc ribbon domain-containing protein [Candidatus Bathyarchaeota archaeon]
MPYCEKCGAEVNADSNFCRNCGAPQNKTPVQAPAAAPQPTPVQNVTPAPAQAPAQAADSEPVLGVLLLRKPKSFGRYDTFTGVVTAQRLIFAQMTNDMLKDAIQQARDQAKAEGKGFWGQWGDQMKASFGYTQRYLSMAPSAALAETAGNFDVKHGAVREVKLKLKDVNQGNMESHEFELEIQSAAGKFGFRMDENKDCVQLLKQVYGERVKMPRGYFGHGFKIGF